MLKTIPRTHCSHSHNTFSLVGVGNGQSDCVQQLNSHAVSWSAAWMVRTEPGIQVCTVQSTQSTVMYVFHKLWNYIAMVPNYFSLVDTQDHYDIINQFSDSGILPF